LVNELKVDKVIDKAMFSIQLGFTYQ